MEGCRSDCPVILRFYLRLLLRVLVLFAPLFGSEVSVGSEDHTFTGRMQGVVCGRTCFE